MAGALLPVRVARNDREWTGDGQGHHLLRVRMNHDGTPDLAIALKARAIQPLARGWPFQLGQTIIGSVFVDVLDGGGSDLRHSGIIRIRLRRHVAPRGACGADQLEHRRRFAKAGAVDVHHVQCSTGFAGERKRFFETGDPGRDMHVDRGFGLCRDAEHREQLVARCRRRVRKPGADADRALLETIFQALRDLGDLRGRGSAIGSVAHRHPRAGIVHHRHPDLDVPDADAVVDALAGFALAVPGLDVRRADLELERGRDAVQRIEAIGLRVLSVRVQVDEARGDDQAPCVERVSALDRVRRDDGDAAAREPDISGPIEPGGGIHHMSAEDHAVVDRRRAKLQDEEQSGNHGVTSYLFFQMSAT